MKKVLLSIAASAVFAIVTLGQAPQGFKYQAVVRDASNSILSNQPVGFQLSILEDSITGISIYSETFTPTSNSYGIINIEIGTGTTVDDFSLINWANNSYFLETAIDVNGGSSYVVMGTNQFKSVPYALHSKTVEIDTDEQMLSYDNISGELAISNGNTITLPMTTGGDNWGSQAAETDSTLLGDGTSANPLSVQGDFTDNQNLTGASLTGTSLQIDIENGASAIVDLAPLQDGVDDADNDPTNEIELPANGNTNDVLTWDGTEWIAQANLGGTDADWSIDGSGNMSNANIGDVSIGVDATINGVTVGKGNGNISSNTALGETALFNNGTGATFAFHSSNNTATGFNALYSNTTGYSNTANGYEALYSNTTGNRNTAFGYSALYFNTTGTYNTANGYEALYSNTEGSYNTSNGYYSLQSNTTGLQNTSIGYNSLQSNTIGDYNTASGSWALSYNTEGNSNTAIGRSALSYNTEGNSNVAVGIKALFNNSDRSNLVAIGDSALFNNGVGATVSVQATRNTAVGSKTLYSNTTGSANTANGHESLFSNTTGSNNTANGHKALQYNTTGGYNTANGDFALRFNTEGQFNTAIGSSALQSNTIGNNNVAIGRNAGYNPDTGNLNTFIGYNATGVSGVLNNATAIGANSSVSSDNTIQLGDAQITTVNTSGALTTGAVTYPNTDGSAGQILATDGAGNLSFQTDNVDDLDADPNNEIQTISRSGTTVTLSNSGGTFQDSVGVYTAGPGINIVNNVVSVKDTIATIGLHPELGGYVFWVSPDGKHGLVVETQDQGTGNWYNAQNMISNPANHSPEGQNYRDWRMPTAYELNEIHIQQGAIGNISSGSYWSSTEIANELARSQVLLTGSIESFQMVEQHIIRAVRVFTAIAIPAF